MLKRLAFALMLGLLFSTDSHADKVQPITKLKKMYPDTELVRDGKACAVVYHPPVPELAQAAKELVEGFQAKYGVRLPVKVDDTQRTWAKETQNIIVLGNLENSRLLRWLHYRSFIRPSSGLKRCICTIHDPWGQGRNVVMLGGVDVANVKENMPRFLELVKKRGDGTVFLPRTFDPPGKLSDNYRARKEQYLKELPKMPMNYPAYHAGWVCGLYPGRRYDELAPLYRECIQRLADHKSYVHLYLFRECRTWDVIEESPALTDDDRLMITNFFRDVVADDKEGIGYVRKIMKRHKLIQGNHPSQAACGVLVAAEYLNKYYPCELHEKWYKEALAFFEPYCTKGCYVGDDEGMQGASIQNIMNAVYRITDNPAEHPFLRQMLTRLMPNYNNFGRWPAYGDQRAPYKFGTGYYDLGARIYDSPEFLWMNRFVRAADPAKPVEISTEKATGGWWPLSFAPRQPKDFVGLQWAEPDETLFSMARSHWAEANGITKDDLFGRVAFRAGIDPQDDYLLLDGVHLGHAYLDANGILEYSTLGRTFLVSLDYCYGTKQSAHNVVGVSVDGMADAYPPRVAVRRLWANLPSFAATRTAICTDGRADPKKPGHPSADWERDILWLKNRFFLVFDRVIAKRDGFHSAVGFWRMVGERNDLPNGIEIKQQAGDKPVHFRLTVGGVDHFTRGHEEDPQAAYCFSRYGPQPPPLDNVPPVIHILRAHKARPLKAGECLGMWTCFRASSEGRPNKIHCRTFSPGVVVLDVNGAPMLAGRGAVDVPGLAVDAELSLIGPDRVCLVAARKLSVASAAVFQSDHPISFEWDLGKGTCEIESGQATKATFLGQSTDVAKGRSTRELNGGDLSTRLVSVLKALPAAPEQKKTQHVPAVAQRLSIAAEHKADAGVECLWAGSLGTKGSAVLVGRRDGTVEALDGDALKPLWTYRCERVVNSIDVGDLNGDSAPDIAVGSDDHYLHALARGGKRLWKWEPPFDYLKAKIAYRQWLWPEPFVKKVAVHDLDGDGKAEIVAGTGMNTFGVDGTGKQIWAFRAGRSHLPCMRAIVFMDVNGDGVEEPVGGASDMWYCAPMWAIGPKGDPLPIGADGKLRTFASDGWCSGVKVVAADDLIGCGKKGLAYGTRQGGLWCYPDPNDWTKRWYRRFADEIDRLAILKRADGKALIVVAGGETKWATAFDADGTRVWSKYFDEAIAVLSANALQDELYVGCDDGSVYELDTTGAVRRSVVLSGVPSAIAAQPAGGVVVGTEDGRVYRVR